jgi:hypothetical protein
MTAVENVGYLLYVKRFGSKNSLSPTESGSRSGSRASTPTTAQAIFRAEPFHVQYPTFSTAVTLHTYSPMKMGQSFPRRRHLNYRRRGITQKKHTIFKTR